MLSQRISPRCRSQEAIGAEHRICRSSAMKGKLNRHPAMTQSIRNNGVELEDSQRRIFLRTALVAGLGLPLIQKALADETPSANERPQVGDHFVFAQGENEGTEIKASDLPLNGPPALGGPRTPRQVWCATARD